jgi:hypothetical protein
MRHDNTDKSTNVDGGEAQIRHSEEADSIDANFLKRNADIEVREEGRRHYAASVPTLSIGKPVSVSNTPMVVRGADQATYNRIEPFYVKHAFKKDIEFDGSIYYNYKLKAYPTVDNVNASFTAYLARGCGHLQKYMADKSDMRVKFRHIGKGDPVIEHNKKLMAARNNSGYALEYVLKPTIKAGQFTSDRRLMDLATKAIPFINTWFDFPKGTKLNELEPNEAVYQFNLIYQDKHSQQRGGYVNLFIDDILNTAAPIICDHDSGCYIPPSKRRKFV